jgi:hypothetical protein
MRLYGFAGCESDIDTMSRISKLVPRISTRLVLWLTGIRYTSLRCITVAGFVAGLIFSILGAVHLFIGFYVYVLRVRSSRGPPPFVT